MTNKKLNKLVLNWFYDVPNAGDRFAFALAEHFFSDAVRPLSWNHHAEPNLLLVGSYLHNVNPRTVVCGGGFLSAQPHWATLPTAPHAVHCVRGPLTAELLRRQNVPCPDVYADPGILAAHLFPRGPGHAHYPIGIIPHFKEMTHPWLARCREDGCAIIDPRWPLEDYFARLTDCRCILSSSLHGLIFAHAYGIPALWIELSSAPDGDDFKYYDYYASLGVPQSELVCLSVTEDTNPHALRQYATWHNTGVLVPSLLTALAAARESLERLEDRC